MNITVDYYDEDGIKRRVLVPDTDIPPREGIPLSLPVDKLYNSMPREFRVRLMEALWSRGLVEPADFFKPGAAELTRNAIMDTCKFDALDIISLAKEHMR